VIWNSWKRFSSLLYLYIKDIIHRVFRFVNPLGKKDYNDSVTGKPWYNERGDYCMSQNLGTDFVVKIASLADDASIVEAFQYYHQGGLTGSPAPESMEYHLNQLAQTDIDIQNQIDTLQADISLLQQEIGDSLAPTYVKMNPTSNSDLADANIINAPQGVMPLQIEGSAGTTEPLQQWRIGTDVVAEIRPDGSFATDDGNGNLVEIINNSTEQTLENKVIINSVLITDMETRSTSFTLGLAQQGKTIECNSAKTMSGLIINCKEPTSKLIDEFSLM
jgi:hypothetical protein